MEKHAASATSLGVASLRAAHQLIDNEPLLLKDPVILQLMGPIWSRRVRENPAAYERPELKHLRSHVVLRSRFAEDQLQIAWENGIRQYLILGAGLDTFSWRQPAGLQSLQIFELDHPATQAQKLQDIGQLGLALPENVHFIPADLESMALQEVLDQHGFDASQPSFISWLGVMVYLSMEAIDEVLEMVCKLPAGSRIVFTFSQRREQNEQPDSLGARAAALGEPWKTFFNPEELRARLLDHGFSEVSFLEPADAARLYYQDRTDDLPAPRNTSICLAIV